MESRRPGLAPLDTTNRPASQGALRAAPAPLLSPKSTRPRSEQSSCSEGRAARLNGSKSDGALAIKGPRRRNRRLEKFLERQNTGPSELRRFTALLHRDLVAQEVEEKNSNFFGAHGAAGFRRQLKTRYGSIATAWRSVLDKDDNGKMSMGELCQVCRDIGYHGNIKKLWIELDQDQDGFVCLADLDVEQHQAISDFLSLLLEKYGSTLEGWRQGLDVAGTHRLEEKEFVARCQEIGYTGNARKLFRWLRVDPHHKFVTLKEIDPQAHASLKCGDPCAESRSEGGRATPSRSPEPRCFSRLPSSLSMADAQSTHGSSNRPSEPSSPVLSPMSSPCSPHRMRMNQLEFIEENRPAEPLGGSMSRPMSEQSFSSSPKRRRELGAVTPTRTSKWIRELSTYQRTNIKLAVDEHEAADCGVKDLSGLRQMLLTRYGSMHDAWRRGLDPEHKGRLSFPEMCDALRNQGYAGNLNAIFQGLGKRKTDFVYLKDFDPKTDMEIKEYKRLCKEKHGTLAAAWKQSLDKTNQGCTDEATFMEHCNAMGWQGDATKLFRELQTDQRSKFLPLRDWDKAACKAIARGDIDMISETMHEKSGGLELTFDERQEASFHQRWAKAQAASYRNELGAMFKDARDKDCGAVDLDSLKALLIRKYGTLAAGWRRGLDVNCMGRLSFYELCEALRKIGFNGTLKGLWDELDKEKLGYITLASFDPEADAALSFFRAQLVARWGNVISGWKEGFDIFRAHRLEEKDFVERFQELGLEGDARFVFINLMERGRAFITMKDIDPRAQEAYYRGDHQAMTVKTPKSMLSTPTNSRPSSPASPMKPKQAPVTKEVPPPPLDSPPLSPSSNMDRTGNSDAFSPSNSPTDKLSTSASRWSKELGHRMRREVGRQYKEERDLWMGCTTLTGFKVLLRERYGSTVSAWRTILDGDGNGVLSFNEFCIGCRKLAFQGNVKELWQQLDGIADGHVTLKALDPEAHSDLAALREVLLSKHQCLVDAWKNCLDENANVWIDEAEFTAQCAKVGFDPGPEKMQKIFRYLMPDKAIRHLHLEDMQALLIGVPNHEQKLVWMGPKKPPTPVGPKKDLNTRQMDSLKAVLIRNFGSIYTGWWRGLDINRNGSVDVREFAQAVLTIGFPGNRKALIKALGKDINEYVTLRDIDAEVADAIDAFQHLIIAKYGSFGQAWEESESLDPEGKGMVEEASFIKFCNELGYKSDPKKLFRYFLPEAGKTFLFFEDFGPFALAPDARSPPRKREPVAWWRQPSQLELDQSLSNSPSRVTTPGSPGSRAKTPDSNRRRRGQPPRSEEGLGDTFDLAAEGSGVESASFSPAKPADSGSRSADTFGSALAESPEDVS